MGYSVAGGSDGLTYTIMHGGQARDIHTRQVGCRTAGNMSRVEGDTRRRADVFERTKGQLEGVFVSRK